MRFMFMNACRMRASAPCTRLLFVGLMPRMPATNTKSPARTPTLQVPVGVIAPAGARVFTPFGELGCVMVPTVLPDASGAKPGRFVASGASTESPEHAPAATPAFPCEKLPEPRGDSRPELLDPAPRVHNPATRITLGTAMASNTAGRIGGPPVLIFDCNGVLVDSEAIAATVASQELTRAGFKV